MFRNVIIVRVLWLRLRFYVPHYVYIHIRSDLISPQASLLMSVFICKVHIREEQSYLLGCAAVQSASQDTELLVTSAVRTAKICTTSCEFSFIQFK
jgi:hypothetical protein